MDCCNYVGLLFQAIGIIISIIACNYTIKTYKESHDILEVLDSEKRYLWNKKELESLFTTLPIDSIESFFENQSLVKIAWDNLSILIMSASFNRI